MHTIIRGPDIFNVLILCVYVTSFLVKSIGIEKLEIVSLKIFC